MGRWLGGDGLTRRRSGGNTNVTRGWPQSHNGGVTQCVRCPVLVLSSQPPLGQLVSDNTLNPAHTCTGHHRASQCSKGKDEPAPSCLVASSPPLHPSTLPNPCNFPIPPLVSLPHCPPPLLPHTSGLCSSLNAATASRGGFTMRSASAMLVRSSLAGGRGCGVVCRGGVGCGGGRMDAQGVGGGSGCGACGVCG